MKKGIMMVLLIIALVIMTFCGYLIQENVQHEKLLKNYPVDYAVLIRQSAEEFGLDPYFVLSIMRCESSFDADAVSNRGAIGLMQIMPDTGTWVAHKLDMDDIYAKKLLYDPATNIRFGCWYLQFLSNRFDGNRMHMIAAYNAGHRVVENWLEDPAYSDNGQLTMIPYDSTAVYYERVIKAYETYQSLYPQLFLTTTPESNVVA
ncbi:MAG: lytic transglycosylase domain-containing protein [Clostridia bacterium]